MSDALSLLRGNKDKDERRQKHLSRLSAVLAYSDGPAADLKSQDDPAPPPPHWEDAAAAFPPPGDLAAETSAGAGAPLLNSGGSSHEPAPGSSSGENRIDILARRISEALAELQTHTTANLAAHTRHDRAELEALGEEVARLTAGMEHVRTEIAALRAHPPSAAQVEEQVLPRLTAFEQRFSAVDSALASVLDRLNQSEVQLQDGRSQIQSCLEEASGLKAAQSALVERVETLNTALHAQIEALQNLILQSSKLQEAQFRLEERLAAQECTLARTEEELHRRGGLLAKIAGAVHGYDRRQDPRFPAERPVKVVLPGDPEKVVSGRVFDASKSGLGLILEAAVPAGAAVRVEAEGSLFSGKVAYCRPQGKAFIAGLSSVERFEPPAGPPK